MMVPGHGPLGSKIMIIGEAPGEEEDRQGLPFVGASGKLLTSMLETAGINRNECYLTNVVKLRPPKNDFSIFYQDKSKRHPSQMLLDAYNVLYDEIKRVRPNVICCVGGESLRAITGRSGIDNWRGSILSTPYGKCIPTLHPAYVLRMYGARPIVELDLKRVREESDSSVVDVPVVTCEIRPSFERVCEYLGSVRQRAKRIAFDIETTGSLVRCLGLSDKIGHAICVPFISSPNHGPQLGSTILFKPPDLSNLPTSHWTEEQERVIHNLLFELFADPSVEKVGQNIPFDMARLAEEFGYQFNNVSMDSMVAHHWAYCELPKGLDFLCSIYTRIPYYSDYDPSSDEQTWRYNCYDAAVTLEVCGVEEVELAEAGIKESYFNQKHPTTLALVRVEQRGVLIDTTKRSEIAKQVSEAREKLKLQIQTFAASHGLPPDFNPDSDKQVKELLYEKLRLPVQYNYKTKAPTSDKNALSALRKKSPQAEQILEQLEQHSKLSTLLSGFLAKQLGPDGRIRTHFNSAGTVTDRLSSSEPLFAIGTNLQNIPVRGGWEKIRGCFRSDEDWTWIKADLSQAEFRIVAWLAKIDKVIEEYQANPKWRVHRYVASLAYNTPEDKVTKQQDDDAKNGVYGGNYAMQPPRAALVYKIPIEKARFILGRYREIFPEIPRWWLTVQATINSTRCIRGPFDNLRWFFDRLGDSPLAEIYRDAYSHSAQNIVANIVNRSLHICEESFEESDAQLLLQVHDELDVQAKGDKDSENVIKTARFLKRSLEYPLYFPGIDVPLVIPAEIKIGKNWHELEKVEV